MKRRAVILLVFLAGLVGHGFQSCKELAATEPVKLAGTGPGNSEKLGKYKTKTVHQVERLAASNLKT